MQALVQSAPNFSEGRREEVIAALVGAVATGTGARVLTVAPDPVHNRTVITFVGSPEAVATAAMRGAEAAVRLIDLNQHRGSYPRMGAVDVIPFIPVSGCNLETCIALARQVGADLGSRLLLPVYLYDAAASRPDRHDVAAIRAGEFEGLRERVGRDPAWAPDFGPPTIHPTAGATAVGARLPFVILTLTLSSAAAADQIAAGLNLPGVRPLGSTPAGEIDLRISYHETPLHAVVAAVSGVAAQHGATVLHSELSGLVPAEALVAVAAESLRLKGFAADQVLESVGLRVEPVTEHRR